MGNLLDWCRNHTFLEILQSLHHWMIDTDGKVILATAVIIIIIAGLVGGGIAKKLKQPLILGYIITGVLVGIAYKAAFAESASIPLESLANIGVALLLFSMGLEFHKDDIKPIYKVAIWGTIAQVLFTFLTGACLAWGLSKFQPGLFSRFSSFLLFGTAFVSTSTAVLIKTLGSKQRMGTLSSKVMIGMSIVQDLTVMPLMLFVSQIDKFSGKFDFSTLVPLLTSSIFMFLMIVFGTKWFSWLLSRVAKLESKELFLLATTGIALGSALLAENMQAGFSFGAFLAGIALSESDYGKKALDEIMSVRDLFAMLFFVSIGMMLDVHYLFPHFWLVLSLVILTGMSRTLFLSVITYRAGFKNVIPVAMMFGMMPTSEIAFVVIQNGKGGLFNDDLCSLVLCVVVCSMLVGPVIDSLTSPIYKLLKKTIWKDMKASDFKLPSMNLSGHVLITGGAEIARSIARLLSSRQFPYLIIEPDHTEYLTAQKQGLSVLFGDPANRLFLESACVNKARCLLAIQQDVQENIKTIKMVRALQPDIHIVTRADMQQEVNILLDNKIKDEIVQPKFEAGLELARQALVSLDLPSIEIQNYLDGARYDQYSSLIHDDKERTEILTKLRSFAGLVQLKWVKLPEGSRLIGQTLANSRIRSLSGVSIVGILHNGKFISNPTPDTTLFAEDILAAIGSKAQQDQFGELIGAKLADTPEMAQHFAPQSRQECFDFYRTER